MGEKIIEEAKNVNLTELFYDLVFGSEFPRLPTFWKVWRAVSLV